MKNKVKCERNICFIAPLPPPYGGIANWTAMMCRYLDKERKEDIHYSVIDIAPKKRITEGRTLWNRIVDSGFEMLKIRKALKQKLKSEEISCVHMTASGSLSIIRDYVLCCTAAKCNVPIVYHIRFGRIPEIKKAANVEWRILERILKKVQRVIAIDKKTYDVLHDLMGGKVSYISNPINVKEMPEISTNKQQVVFYLGWVIKEKGIEELIQAWERVHANHKDWELHIVGPYKTEYHEYLCQQYNTEGIQFLGEKKHEDAVELLNCSSVFVLPSYTEGCPNVILEAMALGKEVVATSVGNIPEMLSGTYGYVVPSHNVEELERALNGAIEGSQEEKGMQAREKVLQQYEIGKVVQEYMKVWTKAEARL